MLFFQFIPVILSLVVLAAHFLRTGGLLVTMALLALVGLLALRRRWVPRLIQAVLVLGALEWLRTLVMLTLARMRLGEPFARMVVILGVVALVTGLSALILNSESARDWFANADDAGDEPEPEET